jgi:hypothetical protein
MSTCILATATIAIINRGDFIANIVGMVPATIDGKNTRGGDEPPLFSIALPKANITALIILQSVLLSVDCYERLAVMKELVRCRRSPIESVFELGVIREENQTAC